MVQKQFIRADELLRDSFALARSIYDSGYRPDVLLVLWRGGSATGLAVHEYFLYKGIGMYHYPVKCESYLGIARNVEPLIEHEATLISSLRSENRVLIVDDIFDSGRTMVKLRSIVEPRVAAVRTATLYLKTGKDGSGMKPDYWLKTTDQWIVFPHELQDLTPGEIRQKDAAIYSLLGMPQSLRET